ncbi:MAG: hypothetical protein IJY46_08205 [Lentisphaeria bacterium]|nr:hypothetical protein [Lentisphaeria bacterium]
MRIFAVLVLVAAVGLQLDAAAKKFARLGEYKNVQITRITQRGIQILHADGISYINIENLSDSEKELIKDEIAQWEAAKKKAAADKKKAAIAKRKADQQARAKKAAAGKVQDAEVNKLLKLTSSGDIYKILGVLEKHFGTTKNKSMGLRGRCNSVIAEINHRYPDSKVKSKLIKHINTKRVEREKASREKAQQGKAQAAEIDKFMKNKTIKDGNIDTILEALEKKFEITPEDKNDKDARVKAVIEKINTEYSLTQKRKELIKFINDKNK